MSNSITALLQLVRWKNLLIVLFAQLVVWYFVNYQLQNDNVLLTPQLSFLLIISTVFIAAAGYIINDYFDIKIDTINRPDTVLVTKTITKQVAILWHFSLSTIGIVMAGYIAYKVGNKYLVLIQIVTVALLWYYSTYFKRKVLVGNIIVSFMTALSLLLFYFYEPAMYKYLNEPILINHKINAALMIFGISVFAFMLNMVRELVKDMEDYKGDAELGCMTYPIKYGLGKSAQLAVIILIITIIVLVSTLVYFFAKRDFVDGFLIFILITYLSFLAVDFRKSSSEMHFEKHSRLLKIGMILGLVCFAIICIL